MGMVMWLLGFLGSLGHVGDDDDILATRVSCVCCVHEHILYFIGLNSTTTHICGGLDVNTGIVVWAYGFSGCHS